jgi:hypothetical protein
MLCPSSSFPFNNPDGCHLHPGPEECDLAEIFPVGKDPYFVPAPLYVLGQLLIQFLAWNKDPTAKPESAASERTMPSSSGLDDKDIG